jgi:hypothetical protein
MHAWILWRCAASDPAIRSGRRSLRWARRAPGSTALVFGLRLTVTGARLGGARAAAYLHRRSLRAIELGFADLIAYYQRRYRDERRRVDEIAAELGCAESAVRGDLQRLGLGPDRTRSHGARWQTAR